MKAIATCPKCKEIVETLDREDVDSGMSFHDCKGKHKSVKVKWKVFLDSEKEILDEDSLDSPEMLDMDSFDED